MKKLLIIILLCFNYVNAQTLCDSFSCIIGSNQQLTLIAVNNSTDSVNFMWGVCDNNMCYSSSGDTAYFPLVNPLDTVKICYDVAPIWTCTECYYVIFNGFAWQLLNFTTHVNEIKPILRNSKIYDLLGRELKSIPKRGIYIMNGRIYSVN